MTISFLQSLAGEVGFNITEENLQIRSDQLRARLRLYPVMIVIQTFLEPLFVWLFWDHADHQHLLLWLACIFAIHTIDLLTWWRYREHLHTVGECSQWSRRFKLFTVFTSLMWGMNALWFFPQDLPFTGSGSRCDYARLGLPSLNVHLCTGCVFTVAWQFNFLWTRNAMDTCHHAIAVCIRHAQCGPRIKQNILEVTLATL